MALCMIDLSTNTTTVSLPPTLPSMVMPCRGYLGIRFISVTTECRLRFSVLLARLKRRVITRTGNLESAPSWCDCSPQSMVYSFNAPEQQNEIQQHTTKLGRQGKPAPYYSLNFVANQFVTPIILSSKDSPA